MRFCVVSALVYIDTVRALALKSLRAHRETGSAARHSAAAHQALRTERVGPGNTIRLAPPESAVRVDTLDAFDVTTARLRAASRPLTLEFVEGEKVIQW